MMFFLLLMICWGVHAGRPLITDDSGVVPDETLQIETWFFADERSGQYWIVPTMGLENRVEISAAAVQGTPFQQGNVYTYSGPLLQSKVLLYEADSPHVPSFALSGGAIAPYGRGQFKTKRWDYFYYAAMSYDPPWRAPLIIHLNLGQQTRRSTDRPGNIFLWGAAVEVKTHERTHVFVEAANGDVYAIIPGVALQVGARHDLTSKFQIDGTLGRGVSGSPILPVWASLGIKVLID